MTTDVARPQSQYKVPSLNLDQAPSVGWARLVKVELRKATDTRGSIGLFIAIGIITVITLSITMWAGRDSGASLAAMYQAAYNPQVILIPIVAILTVASEWTQRTTLTTFTQEPRRMRVMGAKTAAILILGLAMVATTVVLAMLAHLASTAMAGTSADFGDAPLLTVNFLIQQLVFVLQGLALGALFLNVPIAIVAYVGFPVVMAILTMIGSLENVLPWIDLTLATMPLNEANTLSSEEWAKVGVATFFWVGIPMILGLLRVSRKEIK